MTIKELLEKSHDAEAMEGLDMCEDCNNLSCAFRHAYDWQKKSVMKNRSMFPLFQCPKGL